MFKQLLSVLISFQIVFLGVPFKGLNKAYSQESNEEEVQISNEAERKAYGELFESLLGSNKANPLDFFSLLRQDFIKENSKGVNYSPNSVVISVRGEPYQVERTEEVQKEVKNANLEVTSTVKSSVSSVETVSDLKKRFTVRESLYDKNFDGMVKEGYSFGLILSGKLVHYFRVPIEAIAVLGDYVVFIEKNSYNAAENIRQVSFLDLNYFRLGHSEIPIFRVPVEGHEELKSFEINKGVLNINGISYDRSLFDFATDMQRILFNVAVNITDSKQMSKIADFADPFYRYFLDNLEDAKNAASSDEAKRSFELVYNEQMKKLSELKQKSDGLSESEIEKVSELFASGATEKMKDLNKSLSKQRGLVGRVGLLWQQLSLPRPAEPGLLKQKLVTLAVGVYKNTYKRSDFVELTSEILSNSTIRITGATLAAIAAAYYMPDQSLYALQTSFEYIKYMGEFAFGKISDLGNLAYETILTTFQGFNPIRLYEVYVANGSWMKTSVGLSAMFSILMVVVGIPHILLNTYYLTKDFIKADYISWDRRQGNTEGEKIGILRLISKNFILRQKRLQHDYIKALEGEISSKEEKSDVSDEEKDRLAREFLDNIEIQKSEHEGLLSKLQKTWIVQKASERLKHFTNIESFAGALTHFLFSFASFTKSGIFYATTWNYFYLLRVFLAPPKPKLAATLILFPNFFKRSVATELGKITPPSYWNGGTRWIWQEVSVQIRRRSDSKYYESLKKFETSVIEIEKKINEVAMTESFKALTRYLKSKDKVLKLSEKDAEKKLTHKSIMSLGYDARSFFAAYYDKLVERSMREYLYSINANDEESKKFSIEELKKWLVTSNVDVNEGKLDARELVLKHSSQEGLYQEAYEVVHRSPKFLEKVAHAQKYSAMANLDPVNRGQFKRFVLAEQQMKKATAMARAVRANIVATLVDKPMELLLLFILVAGVTDGPNKPLWDAMFSADSAFYMSRYVFMGYLSGLLVNIFADVWVKVQQDIRVDNAGGFDLIPENEHKNKSFKSWYWYQFRTNKENKWWDHHKYFSEIIYHNLGPAFILFTITGMATLGRIDLDFYFLGYMTAFFLPFTGLSLKFEQTFEIASGWIKRDVPKAIRSHPLIIEWAGKEATKLRMYFQFAYKLYENVLGQFIGNLMAITTAANGTRSLSRILFGGKTLTEHAIEKTTELSEAVPQLRFTEDVCRLFFAKNYTSGTLPPPSKR